MRTSLNRLTQIGFTLASLSLATIYSLAAHAAEPISPLVLETIIPLPNVKGRIDHLAIDLVRQRLFVAEFGNNTLDVIDLATQKLVHRITGLNEPQGVAYLPGPNLVVVRNGGEGAVRFFSGADFSPRGVVMLGDDADNVRVDPRNGQVIVGYGMGRLAVIDPLKPAWLANMPLPAHPESFRLSLSTGRIFVNVPQAGKILTFDLASRKPLASWTTPGLESNFPMTVDESSHAVMVVFRRPARLAAFDMDSGRMTESIQTCGDSDDLFYDANRRRIYVICGAGLIDVVQKESGGALKRLAYITTAPGARTSLFVPELNGLYVAVPSLLANSAAIQVYRTSP